MLHGFSKVGFTEQIFSLKNKGLGNEFSPKLVCLELKFLPKSERNGPKNAKNSGKWRA